MIEIEQAKEIVKNELLIQESNLLNDSLIIVDDFTIERPYAWIFIYTSKNLLETNDSKYLIAGNAPIIVDKRSGKMKSYSTAFSTDEIIDKYEEEGKLWSLTLLKNNTLDNSKLILLKNKMNLRNDDLILLKNGKKDIISKGSESRLKLLQREFQEIGIETEILLSFDNK
jgi:hypothetical protein